MSVFFHYTFSHFNLYLLGKFALLCGRDARRETDFHATQKSVGKNRYRWEFFTHFIAGLMYHNTYMIWYFRVKGLCMWARRQDEFCLVSYFYFTFMIFKIFTPGFLIMIMIFLFTHNIFLSFMRQDKTRQDKCGW